MTNEEAIKCLRQLYPNGGHCWLDEQRMEAIGMAIEALSQSEVTKESDQKEPASEELEDEADRMYFELAKLNNQKDGYEIKKMTQGTFRRIVRHFANWQKQKDLQEGLDSEALPIAYMDGVEKGKAMMRERMMKEG